MIEREKTKMKRGEFRMEKECFKMCLNGKECFKK